MHERNDADKEGKRGGGMEGQREGGRVRGRERQREDKQTDPIQPKPSPESNQDLVQAKGIESYSTHRKSSGCQRDRPPKY